VTDRGEVAKKELEASPGKKYFEVIKIDLADIDSLKTAPSPAEDLVMFCSRNVKAEWQLRRFSNDD
jgi:hypothetical protein